MTPIRRTVEINDVHISLLEWGTASPGKPSLVILHGLISAAETFTRLVAALPLDWHIIALDLPGFGQSDCPGTQDVSFQGTAQIVARTLSDLGLEKPILLGHSHGGAIALQLATLRPQPIAALILMCPAHPYLGTEQWLVRTFLTPPGKLLARSLPLFPDWVYRLAFRRMPGRRSLMTRAEIAPYIRSLKRPGIIPHTLRILATWQADMFALRTTIEASPITLPTLIFAAEKDPVIPPQSLTLLLPQISDARLITVPGSGHLPNEEAPAECASAISQWHASL